MNEETNIGWVKNIYLSYYFNIGLQTCLKKYDVGDYINLERTAVFNWDHLCNQAENATVCICKCI